MWEPIFVGLGVAALIIISIIVVFLVRISVAINKRDGDYKDVLEQAIDHMGTKAFEREKRKVAKRYVEWDRAAKWIEELSQEGKLDITHLACETKKRAYALTLKKAEDCLIEAEDALDKIRHEISKLQREIVNQSKIPHSVKTDRRALNVLLEQEALAKKRVKSARKRLDKLISAVSPEDDGPSLTEVTLPDDDLSLTTVVLPEEVAPILPLSEEAFSTQPNDQPMS